MAKKNAIDSRNLYRVAIDGLALTVCVILIAGCISFDIADSPSKFVYPHNQPAQNWCGQIGAFFSYYGFYYLGPGIFMLLAAGAAFFAMNLFGVHPDQLIFRIVGTILTVAAVSAAAQLWVPVNANTIPIGPGGVLGAALSKIMTENLADVGTVIVIISSFTVGMFLLADTLVITLLKTVGIGGGKFFTFTTDAVTAAKERSENLNEIWHKLSLKQQNREGEIVIGANQQLVEEPEEKKQEDKSQKEQEQEKPSLFSRKKPKPKPESEQKQPEKQPAKKPEPAAAKTQIQPAYIPDEYSNYTLPPLDLLKEPEHGFSALQGKVVREKAKELEEALEEFNVSAKVVAAEPGPAITMFELELAAGTKVSQIANLANDMARALGSQTVRVVAPLPGKHTIGIEVPNTQRETVRIRGLVEDAGKKAEKMHIPLYLGKDSSGNPLFSDLTSMPHLLIAGTTGSGKSVCINTIIASILLKKRPDEVKLILVDPKMVEMTAFNQVPHLMSPIITETQKAEKVLEWAATKMDERYALLAEAKAKSIAQYNSLGSEEIIRRFEPSTVEEEAQIPKKLPYIVVIVDELADLMMTSGKEIEGYIVRLAQKSRAVGIHLVLATQRPQATVVTGLIKSNMPARIAFRVAARMDSRIILDQNGGETLLGQGDMLFLIPGTSDLVRSQGAFVDDEEVRNIVKHLKNIAEPHFHPELMQLNRVDISSLEKDDLFDDAVEIVLETKRGSVSLLQRRLGIGYARASRIIESMAQSGILGEYKGSQAREVMMTAEQWKATKSQMAADAAAGYADLEEHAEPDEPQQPDEEDYDQPEEDYEDDADEVEDEDDEEYYEDDDEDDSEYDSPTKEIIL